MKGLKELAHALGLGLLHQAMLSAIPILMAVVAIILWGD